jgi:hypothetical protein
MARLTIIISKDFPGVNKCDKLYVIYMSKELRSSEKVR